jgi:hypothetical protein
VGQGSLGGFYAPPFSLTPPPEAAQEKGDLNSYNQITLWIRQRIVLSKNSMTMKRHESVMNIVMKVS